MSRIPVISRKHKLCVICEGLEEYSYFQRLISLNVWSREYEFSLVNAKGESNIFARFQDAYNNDNYEVIIIFCDTDKYPYKEYTQVKRKINDFFDKRLAGQKLIIWANPCSMQIVLSHFADVCLVNQGKKTNADIIERLTGVTGYDGHEKQIEEICNLIYQRTYPEMKSRLTQEEYCDSYAGTSNIVHFLDFFENDDLKWIADIKNYLEK